MNRRTALITAGAVAATLLVGTGAIAANIAVLNSADDDSIGDLSAEMPVASPAPLEPQVVDVYVEDPPPATAAPTTAAQTTSPTGQEYGVEEAGAVTLRTDGGALLVDSVAANPGWQWSSQQASPTEVHVTFTNPDKTYEFFASLTPEGTIDARVDQPVVNVVKVPAPEAVDDGGGGGSGGAGGGGSGTAANPAPPAQAAPTPAPQPPANNDDDHDDDHGDDDEDDDYDEPEDDYEDSDDGHDDDEHEDGHDDDD